MADTKITGLNALATPAGADLVAVVDDVAGTAETKKVTLTNLAIGLRASSTTQTGVVELATGAETNTGTDATRAVTPDGLDDWTGSAQITTLGTIATGTWSGDVIVEAKLENQSGTNTGDEAAADLTTAGVVELATGAETNTGTDATRAVTPDGLTDWTGQPALTGALDLLYADIIGVPANTQTGTSYTGVIGDAGKMITMDNGSANLVTIPANASVAYTVGTELHFSQLGAGATTVAITSDTLSVESSLTLVLAGQYAVATAKKITATTWILFGNLTAS